MMECGIFQCGLQIVECGLFSRRSRYLVPTLCVGTHCLDAPRHSTAAERPGCPFPRRAWERGGFRNRRGISLLEVLISMFVLLFGLMGVAAIFPVGNYYVVEGEKHDQGSLLAANAFEELQTRGMLRPEYWHYADADGSLNTLTVSNFNPPDEYQTSFLQPQTLGGTPNVNVNLFNIPLPPGSGHAFVLDPMGTAAALDPNPTLPNLDIFPYDDSSGSVDTTNPWSPSTIPSGMLGVVGERWPVRRLTVLDVNGLISSNVAETIFRLRDDLAVEMPERDDVPSIQRWSTADIDNNGNANNTPDDPTDDTLLSRQYQGNFSWLATIVPSTEEALLGLQPAVRKSYLYEVSVAVFYKRVPTPSAETERLINAEMIGTGELAIYATGANAIEIVDAAVEGIRPSNWIAVMGVNQTTGTFMLKWYRLLALDDETHQENLFGAGTAQVRYAMLVGPDWPSDSYANLRVAILPGIASVVTREMVLERDSMWNAN